MVFPGSYKTKSVKAKTRNCVNDVFRLVQLERICCLVVLYNACIPRISEATIYSSVVSKGEVYLLSLCFGICNWSWYCSPLFVMVLLLHIMIFEKMPCYEKLIKNEEWYICTMNSIV